MVATITKKLELHNPYALNTDGGSRVDFPKAMQPVGKTMSFECWRHGGQDFLDGDEYLNRGIYDVGAGTEDGFYFRNTTDGKLEVCSGKLNRVEFTEASSHYMTVPVWSPGASSFTIEMLVKVKSTTDWRRVLAADAFGSNGMFMYYLRNDDAKCTFEITDDSANSASVNTHADVDVQDSLYHMISIAVDRTNDLLHLYVDGGNHTQASIAALTDNITIAADWEIAKIFNAATYMDMDIAQFRVWSDVRTPTEISDYAWRYLAGTETGLVRYYDFSNQAGAQVDDRVSGGSNHGTLVNTPTWSNVGAILETSVLTLSDVEGWHRYGFSCDHDEGDIAILLDGKEIASETGESTSKQCLIYPANAFYWLNTDNHGKYSDVRFWEDVRTEAEFADNMFIELVGTESGLVAYYLFEERTGTTLGDETSNNYDATITSPQWVAGFPNQGGGWVDITADLMPDYGFSHYQGCSNAFDLRNRTASPGKLSAVLNNSVKNSASTAGLYSPKHASVRDGFIHGAGIRVSYTYSGTTRIYWVGRIYDIEPDPEQKGSNNTRITAYDWMFEASKQAAKGLTVETNKRVDQGMETVLDTLPLGKRPQTYDFDVGAETMNYIFDDVRDERTKVSGIFRRFALTEFGRITMNGAELLFLNRHAQVHETTVQHDFDDAEPAVEFQKTSYPERGIFTRVKAKSHPREIDSSDVVLATLNQAISVVAGETEPVTLRFRDPSGFARISAASIVDPLVSSTDFVGNANEDGSGADLTANMTVTVVEADLSANSVKLNIYNSGAQLLYTGGDAGVLQVRGKGMYRFDPALSESVSDQDTLDKYGDRELEYDLPYGDNPLTADGYSTYILDIVEVPRLDIGGVNYFPEATATLATAFMDINMSVRITCARTMLGLDADFFVTRIEVQAIGKRIKVIYGVDLAGSSAYIQLDDPIYAKMDAAECKFAF